MKKTILILLMGTVLSVTIFLFVKQWEESKRQQEFEHRAQAHTAALITRFEALGKQLENMRFLLESNINHESEALKHSDVLLDMLAPTLSHEPAIIDFDWAVPISPNQARVTYSWKHKSDLEEELVPINKEKLTGHIQLNAQSGSYLQLVSPITNQLQHFGQPLSGEVIAALVSTWDIATLIEQALKHTPVAAQDIRIAHIQDGQRIAFYFHSSRSRTAKDKNIHTRIHATKTFIFAGLTFHAEYEAAPRFLKDFPIVLAWQTLFIWLAATFLLAWYIYKKDKYTEHVEKLVEKRTKKLNKKRKKLRQIIENLQDIYYQIDLHGNILMVSPSIDLLGYTAKEAQGLNIQEFCVDQNELKVLLEILQDSDKGKVHNRHIRVLHQDGSLRWLSMNAQYRYDEHQEIISIEGTLRDFTAMKKQQEKLQQADKFELLGLMAGSIAHNFNNILTAMLGHATLARMAHEDNPKLVQHMDAIENSGFKAAEICKQMLAYTGQGTLCIQPLHLSQALEEVKAMIRASIPDSIQLNFAFEADLACIRADKSQIQQLAIDLILNAAESYDPQVGSVHISTGSQTLQTQDLRQCIESEQAAKGDFIYLRIQDMGCGIPNDMHEKVFDPFMTSKFTGRGLGLSAVRGIVRSLHGAIALKSQKGKGTTFTIFFPVESKET